MSASKDQNQAAMRDGGLSKDAHPSERQGSWPVEATGSALDKVRSHEPLGSTVYAAIRVGLIRGQFKAGDRVRIRELADFLGTSVTPVRDAVLRLIHDDALVMKSARDIRVATVTPEEYLEIRDIRLELEGMAAGRAALKATPETIRRVEELIRENEEALAERKLEKAIECNQRFHFLLAEVAEMPVLQKVLDMLWLKMGPLISSAYESGGRDMIEGHYAVLDAMRRHDDKAASEAIREDILRGGGAIIESLER